jgi:SHAQKYF class myb-like DNA-binding protein
MEALPISSIVNEQAQACLDNSKPLHKPRVVWTEELHQRFLRAIEAAGSEEAAVPTMILKVCSWQCAGGHWQVVRQCV